MELIDRPGSRLGHGAYALALVASLAGIVGCTSVVPRDSPLPRDGVTMADVYKNHMNGAGVTGDQGVVVPRDRLPVRAADDDEVLAQRRELSDRLNNQFERLPNPDLVLHVFPHLAQGRYPVPGYESVFPMYEAVQYAMPGEVAPRYRVDGSFSYPTPSREGRNDAEAASRSKDRRLAELATVAPQHAAALTAFDSAYAARCGTALTGDKLFALPTIQAQQFDRLLSMASTGTARDLERTAGEAVRCGLAQTSAKPAGSSRSATGKEAN